MKALGIRWVILVAGLAALPAARAGSGNKSKRVVRDIYGFRSAGRSACGGADNPERGDVPGWVMITLMSAVLVAALLALAGPALEGMFNQAMDTVSR